MEGRTSRTPAVIGLDVGTSAVKGLLAGEDGPLARVRRGYLLDVGANGRVELDADMVWRAVAGAIRRLGRVARDQRREIVAICCGGSGDEAVWVDDAGAPVAPVPMSLDRRSIVAGAALGGTMSDQAFIERTGLPPHDAYPLTRLAWLQLARPELASRVRHLWAWPEFVAARLGVPPVAEPTLAARSGAFDVVGGRWDEELLASVGVDAAVFPPLAPTGSVIGLVPGEIARRLGLGAGVAVVAGGFDQAMATLGARITAPGIAHLGAGSWEALTLALRVPAFSLVPRGFSVGPTVAADVPWSAMGSSIGGAAIAWIGGFAGATGSARGRATRRAIALAARAPDEPTGLIVQPDLDGGGPALADGRPGGVVAGLRLDVDAGRLARAMLEGIALTVADRLEVLSEIQSVSEMRVTGAGAREQRWLQLRADVTGVAVRGISPIDAGAVAAVALAMEATLPGASVGSALDSIVRLGPLVEPRPDHHGRYAEIRATRARLRSALTRPRR
jgi:xylulokinase